MSISSARTDRGAETVGRELLVIEKHHDDRVDTTVGRQHERGQRRVAAAHLAQRRFHRRCRRVDDADAPDAVGEQRWEAHTDTHGVVDVRSRSAISRSNTAHTCSLSEPKNSRVMKGSISSAGLGRSKTSAGSV